GSFRCGQNCATCPYITNGLTSYTYTFYATGETRSITSPIIRNTKNVIYMVQCNRCNLPYIGETKRHLKSSSEQIFSRKLPLGAPDSHTEMQLIPLEKIHSSRDSVRKARESHLI
ncbi:unnamed protein product, partial [Porites lobata]